MRIAVAGATGNVGRHVVESAKTRGHDILALSRRAGHDLEAGTGLAGVLDGIDAVIDVSNVVSTSAKRSREFFTAVTTHLLTAERDLLQKNQFKVEFLPFDWSLNDLTGRGDPSMRDLAWDLAGTLTGVAVASLIDWMVHRSSTGRAARAP